MTATAVFLIADLAGYTALTEAHGGEEAAATVGRYRELAQDALGAGARIVEQVGDQLLIVADDAPAAVQAAIRLRNAVDAEPRFLGVRVGVHGGPVVERNGRYFGSALNLTARLAAHAVAGEILCSATVVEACQGLDGVAFRGLGALRLKNVPAPVEAFAVVSERANDAETVLDPVCRMRLRRDIAPARLRFGDVAYHFCSLECARTFAANPENYLGP